MILLVVLACRKGVATVGQPRLIKHTCMWRHFCITDIMYLIARFMAVSKCPVSGTKAHVQYFIVATFLLFWYSHVLRQFTIQTCSCGSVVRALR